MNAPNARPAVPKPRRRRWLRRLGLGVAILLAVAALALTWLVQTRAGADFVLTRAVAALDGKLSVGSHVGDLAGPLSLRDVRYRDAGTGVDVRLAEAELDVRLLALFAKRLEIARIDARGLHVDLASVPASATPPSGPMATTPPLAIVLESLTLQDAHVRRDGEALLDAERLELGAAWTAAGIQVDRLALRADAGSLDLEPSRMRLEDFSGHAKARVDWTFGERHLAGTLTADNNGRHGTLTLNLDAPAPATLDLAFTPQGDWPWTLRANLPEVAAAQVLGATPLTRLGLDLDASGDRHGATLGGTARIDAERLRLDPLRLRLDGDRLHIESLHLTALDAPGRFDLKGEVNLAAEPLELNLDADWAAVNLPASLAGQPLSTSGKLALNGTPRAATAKGRLELGPPDATAQIELDLAATPEAIALTQLRVVQSQGDLSASGRLGLQPEFSWDIQAKAQRFDVGAFVAGWPSALDASWTSTGRMTKDGPTATLKLDALDGQLRGQAIEGRADLRLAPRQIIDGDLRMSLGGSHIVLTGRGGTQTDARIDFDIANLGTWLESASGRIHGGLDVRGSWPKLAARGQVQGENLTVAGAQVDALSLDADLDDVMHPIGSLRVQASGVRQGALQFEQVELEAGSRSGQQQLRLDAKGPTLDLGLGVEGQAQGKAWQGRITRLDLLPRGRRLPDLILAAPASVEVDGPRFALGETCLQGRSNTSRDTADTADSVAPTPTTTTTSAAEATTTKAEDIRLCLGAQRGTDGVLAARYELAHLPLALVSRLAMPDALVRVRGELSGSGELGLDAQGRGKGSARLQSAQGSVVHLNDPRRPLLNYRNLTLTADLGAAATALRVQADLDQEGRLDGTLKLATGSNPTPLDGELHLNLNDLSFIELLSTQVAASQGKLRADYAVTGTLDAPQMAGTLQLSDFATEVPAAGLKLREGQVQLGAVDVDRFRLTGSITSGEGTLLIEGEGGLAADAPLTLDVRGTKVLAADIPAARVLVDPDLHLTREQGRFAVSGTLGVPKARVDLSKLPGGGASAASEDVVIVDAAPVEKKAGLPLSAKVNVVLGDDVKLAGFGFDGAVGGTLRVEDRVGRATRGNGNLNVSGTYKAYGQNLDIETGRILFADSELSNPGLDIRAVREIQADEIKAGLLVRGTARQPTLTVFSEPAMEQSEALSYLVTGKPLSALKSGEGDMLGTAARALGTATGDLLAKRIGGRLGVDDIGVSDNAALGGAAFTVGKYLSPKLYLSYGVGIFEPGEVVTLRYLFSRHWNFEAQNATTGSRAGVNYRYEKK